MTNFPPLYECSICGKGVKVTPQGEGVEPIKEFECEHTTAIIWANRKVTLRGVGTLESAGAIRRGAIKITMTLRQFACWVTGRSI